MIKQTINYLNAKIETLKIFSEINCISEKITKGDNKFPALFNGKEYKKIDLDKKDGVCYWKKDSDVSIAQVSAQSSCGVDYLFTIPLKFVGFVRRDKIEITEDELAGLIIKEITTNNAFLKSELKAKKVTVFCKSYKTNQEELAKEEYEGLVFTANFEYIYFSILSDILITTNSNCIPLTC